MTTFDIIGVAAAVLAVASVLFLIQENRTRN